MRSETPAKRRSRRREQSSPCGVRDSNAPVSQPPVSQRLNLWGDTGCRSKDPVFSPLQARQNRTSQTYVRIPADPPPSSGDLLPGVAPPPPPLWCRPPHAWLFRGASQVPAVKMQRAKSALQTMLLRRSVPSWTLLGKSFPGWPSASGHGQLL